MGAYPKPEPRGKKPQKPLKRTRLKVKPVSLSRAPSVAQKQRWDQDQVVIEDIWLNTKHVCFECGDKIKNPDKRHFSHVHGKGARPDLRFARENIVLHCVPCHRGWETGGRRDQDYPKTNKLYFEIQEKYPDNINGR